jgi:2-oxoisovalerate dehydrogenase E2 component (dihydrolipoyl transacylase)
VDPSTKDSESTADQVVKMRGLRRMIADRITQSYQSIPHFSYIEEVDVTDLEKLRKQLNEQYAGQREKLTYLPFLIRAMAKTLPGFPQCNAHYDAENKEYTIRSQIHVGVATQTPDGLKVPVVKDAQAMDLWQLAEAIKQVCAAARDNTAGRDILSGSTITLSSLGALGGLATTPILNLPEVSIIGINKIRELPRYVKGKLEPRQIMHLSSSFDHRVVDGYDAAQLITGVKALIEQPEQLAADPA